MDMLTRISLRLVRLAGSKSSFPSKEEFHLARLHGNLSFSLVGTVVVCTGDMSAARPFCLPDILRVASSIVVNVHHFNEEINSLWIEKKSL